MRIAFYPQFSSSDVITDHFYRLHWYLYPFRDRLDDIVLPHSLTGEPIGSIPEYLDPSLQKLVGQLKVTPRSVRATDDLESVIEEAEWIFVWSAAAGRSQQLSKFSARKKIVNIDHEHDTFAGSHYLKIAEAFPELQAAALAQSQRLFSVIRKQCESDIGYIFGTGPGLRNAYTHDFSDGHSIACNSMVRNRELMDKLRPRLIVIGDPIFHAGCSSYAAVFRGELIAALDRYGSTLVVPLRDAHIYREHLPQRLADRVVAIPFHAGEMPNLNLAARLSVTSTRNILTLFLIPLASTLFRKIRILGCDGRPLTEQSYFWRHDSASQINEEMEKIRHAHPSFFSIDYNEYYLTHCNTLARWLDAAESLGRRVENLTPSYIPALIKRSSYEVRASHGHAATPASVSHDRSLTLEDVRPTVSIIMPARNAARYIDAAIQSVIAQDLEDWELLIVDDSSDDDTALIASRFASQDQRIVCLSNCGHGVSAARNVGLERSRGQYVGFLDADDTMDLGSLRARVARLNEGIEATLTHGPVRFVDEGGRDLGWRLERRHGLTFEDTFGNPASLNTVLGPGAFVRRFRFEEGVANGEDWWFLARMLRSGATSEFVPAAGATYRVHRRSAVASDFYKHESALRSVIDWIYSPSNEPDVAARFAGGLSLPPRNQVIAGREINKAIWAFVSRDRQQISSLVRQGIDWSAAGSLAWFKNAVTLAGIRCLGVHRDELRHVDKCTRDEIVALVRDTGTDVDAPDVIRAFVSVFDVKCDEWFDAERIELETSTREGLVALGHRLAAVEDLLRQIRTDVSRFISGGAGRYDQLVSDISEVVAKSLPRDAIVLLISKGDERLLNLAGRQGWHFPQSADGNYSGYYFADSAGTISHLEALREKGASALVVPRTAFWWFDYYPDFKRHLDGYRCVVSDGSCVIYELSATGARTSKRRRRSTDRTRMATEQSTTLA